MAALATIQPTTCVGGVAVAVHIIVVAQQHLHEQRRVCCMVVVYWYCSNHVGVLHGPATQPHKPPTVVPILHSAVLLKAIRQVHPRTAMRLKSSQSVSLGYVRR